MAKVRVSKNTIGRIATNLSIALMNRIGSGDEELELLVEPRGEAGVLSVIVRGSDGAVIVQDHLVVQSAR
jgi:hypothetical protein